MVKSTKYLFKLYAFILTMFLKSLLTHFKPMFYFYTYWIRRFLTLSVSIGGRYGFFYKKKFHKKMGLKNPKALRKC